MADPFLLAHQIAPRFFAFGRKLSPISIRDQMVRGRLLIDRAVEVGLIGPPADSPLPVLVIGAGAAGATAAIRAAECGVTTLLIDNAHAPFRRQANCQTRWIDPTQYDWPNDHWTQGKYPWSGPAVPLDWDADWAHLLATRWTVQLNQAIRNYPQLQVRFQTTWQGIPQPQPGRVHLNLSDPNLPTDYAMVLLAIGFGKERHEVRPYKGFAFWTTDPLQTQTRGVGQAPARVLVSGAGDGGLQDFLRVVTGLKSAREVYERCHIPPEVERDIHSAEDRAIRAYIWGENDRHDHDVHQELHDRHLDAVETAWSNNAVQDGLSDLLPKTDVPDEIRLVHRCTHFSNCYGLNRLLVLLIAKFLKKNYDKDVVMQRASVTSVKCLHSGRTDPWTCHGEDHEIELQEFLHCYGSAGKPLDPVKANVVVIRHGVDWSGWPNLPQLHHPRQIVPYHVSS